MKTTHKDIELLQENMDRLQAEKAAETTRANAVTNECLILRKQHEEDDKRLQEQSSEIINLKKEAVDRKSVV